MAGKEELGFGAWEGPSEDEYCLGGNGGSPISYSPRGLTEPGGRASRALVKKRSKSKNFRKLENKSDTTKKKIASSESRGRKVRKLSQRQKITLAHILALFLKQFYKSISLTVFMQNPRLGNAFNL